MKSTQSPAIIKSETMYTSKRKCHQLPTLSRSTFLRILAVGAIPVLALLAIWFNAHYTNNPLLMLQQQLVGHQYGYRGAVSSESDICTKIGIDFLHNNGNAADALISTAFCLGVVAMYHVGPGGGGFMLVRGRDGSFETVDFKERAPAAATEDMFVGNEEASVYGGLAVGIPGELRGLEYLHQKYASQPWAELISPSIKLAREGFTINEDLVTFMSGEPYLSDDSSWAIDFAPNGTLKGLGEILTRPRYADTLERISLGGADVFYTGEVAQSSVNAIREWDGIMSLEDLASYQAHGRGSIKISYRNFTIYSDSLPAGGTQGLSIMKTVEGYTTMGQNQYINVSSHRLDEAMRFSWGELMYLGDPDFDQSIEPFGAKMLSEEMAQHRRNKISNKRTLPPEEYNPTGQGKPKRSGTTGVVTADAEGMTIAWTSTVNGFFGSHICVRETGVILNNIMNDFAIPGTDNQWGLPPSPKNFVQPHKRPMDALFNIIVEHTQNRSVFFAGATAGGAHIAPTGAEMLWHVLDRNLTAIEAIQEPRFHDQLHPNLLEID